MAQFYGTVSGKSGTKASRLGSKRSGLEVAALSYEGVVVTRLWDDDAGDRDMVEVIAKPHPSVPNGHERILYRGPVGAAQ